MAPLVIVGSSLAGVRAAQGARAAGFAGEIVVVGDERHLPYTRPPLSKGVLTGEETLESVSFPCDGLDVTWRLGVRATGLDPQAKILTLDGGETLAYDRAVIATGCRARLWTGPGAELDGLFTLRHLDDALALQDALRDQPKVAIVGAGFIGAEVAASARKLGLDVTLIDISPLPVPALGQVVGERCAQMHRERGVDLRLGIGIQAFHGDDSGRVREVELADDTRIAAGVVVVALGAIPNVEWLEGSGLTLQPGVLCDDKLQAVGVDDVLCAGDVAAWPHELAGGEPVRIEHWTNAAEQGTLAGRNAVAPPEERKPYTSVPMFWSDQYDVKMQAVGLPPLAEEVVIVEDDGERFVAIGERAGRVVAAYGWNGARRLPQYRRHISRGATRDDVREAVENDPKALRPKREPRHARSFVAERGGNLSSMKLLVVQHDHASPLGPVAERFVERGYELTTHLVVPEDRFHTPGVETEFPEFTAFDAVVLMGAPWSAYDEQVASWVVPETQCIRRADEAGVPMLGICFGGQMLAASLGGAVVPSTQAEIGWHQVSSDDEALVPSGRWFQWHYDRWELPPQAQEVARNAAASQAFVLRRNLAVQFHPELTASQLAGWLGNGGATKANAAGIEPELLVRTTRVAEGEAHERTRRLVDGFIDAVAHPSHPRVEDETSTVGTV